MLQGKERLGDFEIIRLLGRGGMGEVYEARQFNPDRSVALKVLAPWLANDDEALLRFFREAAVPANLDHPGIVRIISTSKPGEAVAYYAMHLVKGIPLSELIRRGNVNPNSDAVTKSLESVDTPSVAGAEFQATPVSPAPGMETSPQLLEDYRTDRFTTLARIGVQAARALAFAHQQGHLHRDIKPSNLMIDQHDQVYLVDFGLTRGLEPAGSGTLPGVVVGTPWYMSPEQAEGKPLEATADIYSLGVTLYELASQGLGPFTASRDDKKSVLEQVRTGQTLPLRTLAPGIPPALEIIILKAMHLRPHKRYQSAAEMARDLEAFLGTVSKHSPPPVTKANVAPYRRWPIWVGSLLAVVALGISIAVVASIYRDDVPVQRPGTKGSESTATGAILDGTRAFPEILRDDKNVRNQPINLLDANLEPRWSAKLYGSGSYQRTPAWLKLISNSPKETVNILALAEPDWRCFEFTLELRQAYTPGVTNPGDNELGVVFGWARPVGERDPSRRFFVLQLDETPQEKHPNGKLKIGTGLLIPEIGDRRESVEWFKPLPGKKSELSLSRPLISHKLKLLIRDESVSISVNEMPGIHFTLDWLREADAHAAANLSTSGCIGIWTRRGFGTFREARFTKLAAN